MRKTFTLLFVFWYLPGFSQRKANDYTKLYGLKKLDSLTSSDIKPSYTKGKMGGLEYYLSEDSFHTHRFTCISRDPLDSGTWKIMHNQLIFTGVNKNAIAYNVYKIDKFYFLVRPGEESHFLLKFQACLNQVKNTKEYDMSGIIITPLILACLNLQVYYFSYINLKS